MLVGNQDILTPRGDSEDLAATIPTAELVVISGAAHGFMVEHATTFNKVLLEFLGRCFAPQPLCQPKAGHVSPEPRRAWIMKGCPAGSNQDCPCEHQNERCDASGQCHLIDLH